MRHTAGRSLALTILAALLVATCSEPPPTPDEPPRRPAKLHTVTGGEQRRTVELPAVLDATAKAQLAFQQPGRVAALSVREGQAVDAGAEIARLDQRELETGLTKAKTNHGAARTEFERVERLLDTGAIPRATYDQRRTDLEIALASLDEAQRRLDDSVLRAPFPGVIAELHVDAHQNVGAQQAVATLQARRSVEAVVQVPATLVANSGRLEPRETVVILDVAPDRPIPASFHSTATRADPAAQTFEARFAFEPPADLRLLPGMSATVRSSVAADAPGRPAIPIEAVMSDGERRYVWVVDEWMSVAKREVTLGPGVGATLPVLEGLVAGETIVAAGVSSLHEGMLIRRHEP